MNNNEYALKQAITNIVNNYPIHPTKKQQILMNQQFWNEISNSRLVGLNELHQDRIISQIVNKYIYNGGSKRKSRKVKRKSRRVKRKSRMSRK